MAYLSTFEHDIFISYARVDDQPDRRDEPGWVTLFQEYLERRLAQSFGRRGSVTIWHDTRDLGGTFLFDEVIERAIKNSAVFLALNSRGYLSPESYCGKELAIFHSKAKAEPYGLAINSQSRIFNLLIQNIPHGDWPDAMQGAAGLPFHDAETPEGRGWPTPHGSERFERQLRRLVEEIELMLGAFKNEAQVTERRREQDAQQGSTYSNFTVFLGHTQGALKRVSRRIGEELRQKGVNVVTDIPPPDHTVEHERSVKTAAADADLAVHLLDEEPGEELRDAPGKFFSREQVELVRGLRTPQIICVTKMPDAQEAAAWEDEVAREHRAYLEGLGRLGGAGVEEGAYTFIRDTPGNFPREVLAQVERMTAAAAPVTPPGQAVTSAALLDTHPKDMRYVLDLSPVLDERNIDINLVSVKGEPQKGMSLFEESLKTVSVLIVVFGQVTADWVKERLNSALQIVTSEQYPLRLCCIYAPPDERGAARSFPPGGIPTQVPTFRVDRPEFLGSLLDNYMGLTAPAGGKQ